MMTKHTPEPWHRDAKGDLRGRNGEPVYFKGADSDLIEAAPDLLAACKYAVQFSDLDINPTIRKRLLAAISQAERGEL